MGSNPISQWKTWDCIYHSLSQGLGFYPIRLKAEGQDPDTHGKTER